MDAMMMIMTTAAEALIPALMNTEHLVTLVALPEQTARTRILALEILASAMTTDSNLSK